MKKTLLFTGLIAAATIGQAQIVCNGLVAKYYFDKANPNDDLGKNNGTAVGAVPTSDRFGHEYGAYYLDGIDDHLEFGDAPEFRMGAGDFSISIWIKYTESQQGNLMSKRAGLSTNYNMYSLLVMEDAKFGGKSTNLWTFLRSSSSNDRQVNVGNLSGDWHHIVLSHDYSKNTTLYVDGQFAGADQSTVNGDYDIPGHPLVIGYSEETNTNFYKGKVDDIRIYKRALNQLEADSLYHEKDLINGEEDHDAAPVRIQIYPNPTSGKLNLSHSCNILLTGITGKIVLKKENTDVLDISEYAPGFYFISIIDEQGRIIQVIKLTKV
jgi:hypothetical protein